MTEIPVSMTEAAARTLGSRLATDQPWVQVARELPSGHLLVHCQGIVTHVLVAAGVLELLEVLAAANAFVDSRRSDDGNIAPADEEGTRLLQALRAAGFLEGDT